MTFLIVALVATTACVPKPRVRYQGNMIERAPIPAASMEVLRTGPPGDPHRDLGTVTVTCPSHLEFNRMEGGCSYEHAIRLAAEKAAACGGDGIHSIDSAVNSTGAVVSLRATAYYYTPNPVVRDPVIRNPIAPRADVPAPAEDEGDTRSAEERLKRLEKLKAEGLITPEEYTAKRAEILKDI